MSNAAFGVVVLAASVALLWYCKPRNGRQPRIMTRPNLSFLMPIVVLIGLAIGVVLIVTGVGGLS
jgi:hypothetical protein